jgi:hypothetical protein
MRVVGYTKVIPPGRRRNNHKEHIILNFMAGVRMCNDNGLVYQGYDLLEADVAVMQGFMHQSSENRPHIQLRRGITSNTKNKAFITADSNLFLYHTKTNEPHHYLRYSINGVFNDTGNYCNTNSDDKQWKKIQKDLHISLRPWSINEREFILLCLQRNGGWSMKGKDVVQWANLKIAKIRQVSNKPIIVRPHPGDKSAVQYTKRIQGPNVRISFEPRIESDLAKSMCTIVYNSSPAVASVIEGVPVIVEDVKASQVAEVCHTKLSDINNLQAFPRDQWIQNIAQCHWSFQQLASGEAWTHMKRYL